MVSRCLILAFAYQIAFVSAQNYNSDRSKSDDCFLDRIWSSKDIVVKQGIIYGSAYNPAWKKNQTLRLDAYFPPDSDHRTLRPAIVLVHGGFFEFGDRKSDKQPQFAMKMVERGFVAASIDYRELGKYFGLTDNRTLITAVEDARAAVRFMRKMATEWRIDTTRIAIEGDSAGASVALGLGFVKDAQVEGYSGNPGYSSAVNASISVSGELKFQAVCKRIHPKPSECKIGGKGNRDFTSEIDGSPGQPPLAVVHGTEDHTIPFVNGKAMYTRARQVGIKAKLITIKGKGHVPLDSFLHKGTYFNDFMEFLVDAMDLKAAQCPERVEIPMKALFV